MNIIIFFVENVFGDFSGGDNNNGNSNNDGNGKPLSAAWIMTGTRPLETYPEFFVR